jgi:hypothetical protein
MKTLFATLALCAALVASTATSAHDNDAACLAPGAQVIDAGSFSFTPTQLTQFETLHSGGGGMCTPTSCGIVDDHWAIATLMIANYCQDKSPGSTPQVISPSVYNDVQYHHSGYSFSGRGAQNLVGRCVYCKLPSDTPIKLSAVAGGH